MGQLSIVNLLALLLITNCKFTFFVNELRPTSYYKCMKQSTEGKILLLLTYEEDEIDEAHLAGIHNALKAGMTVQLVIVPDRCRTVEEEIKFLSSYVDFTDINRFWIALESYDEDTCSWRNFSPEENCLYLQEFTQKWRAVNVQIQILLFDGDWENAFKDTAACPEPSAISLLWWFEQIEYKQIGGWKTPYMKYLSETQLCGSDAIASQILQ